MSYRTILTVADTAENTRKLGPFVAALAEQFSAHVIGLHIETLATMPLIAPMEMPDPATVQAVQDVAHKETEQAAKTFQQAMVASGISSEWRSFVSSVGFTSKSAIESARCADIIVARQQEASALSDGRAELDGFLYECGRPVLLVPYVLSQPQPIRRVLLAWNGSREATRAAFDALPLLKAAESVEVFSVNMEDNEGQTVDLAGTEIATTLARHGINVTVTSSSTVNGVSPQTAIENRLSDNSIDLLVMGAYGHSRWWEMLFGGVTRTLLDSMTAMTLLSR